MRKSQSHVVLVVGITVALQSMSGCGQAHDPGASTATPEILAAIEARKVNYKEIGGAFKTITDEIKTGAPDLNTIGPMAQEIRTRALDQLKYFPAGSGMESGEKTRGKAEIWGNFADFTASHEKFVSAAERLAAAVQSGDLTGLSHLHSNLGATCKACHDRFREPE